MRYDAVIFYCHFGAGDVYESREFVKEWMKKIDADSYYYAHGKNPKILKDIQGLQFTPVTDVMKPERDIWIENKILYINTWIGRDGSYVLPGIGTTLEQFYKMHNDLMRKLGIGKLTGNPIDYLPQIDYSYFPDINNVRIFMEAHPEDKILIDNGLCQSMQAENFNFNPIIFRLSGAYPNKLFITVQNNGLAHFENILSAGEIICSSDGFDLTELSYLSEYCSCLIGRNSGPHVHMQNVVNCMNGNKKLGSFTYKATGASFVVNSPVLIKKYWSSYENDDNVFRKCREIIDG